MKLLKYSAWLEPLSLSGYTLGEFYLERIEAGVGSTVIAYAEERRIMKGIHWSGKIVEKRLKKAGILGQDCYSREYH